MKMLRCLFLSVCAAVSVFAVSAATTPNQADAATVVARVDISSQRMKVYVNGSLRHTWRVSTGRGGYATPTGSYSAKWLSRHHRSRPKSVSWVRAPPPAQREQALFTRTPQRSAKFPRCHKILGLTAHQDFKSEDWRYHRN